MRASFINQENGSNVHAMLIVMQYPLSTGIKQNKITTYARNLLQENCQGLLKMG